VGREVKAAFSGQGFKGFSPAGEASAFSRAMLKGAVLSICITSDDARLR
jgi:hypothetical protein